MTQSLLTPHITSEDKFTPLQVGTETVDWLAKYRSYLSGLPRDQEGMRFSEWRQTILNNVEVQ